MIWFRLTISHVVERLAWPATEIFNWAAKWLVRETFTAYFKGVRSKFRPLMIVILFSFLGYTTFNIGSNFA